MIQFKGLLPQKWLEICQILHFMGWWLVVRRQSFLVFMPSQLKIWCNCRISTIKAATVNKKNVILVFDRPCQFQVGAAGAAQQHGEVGGGGGHTEVVPPAAHRQPAWVWSSLWNSSLCSSAPLHQQLPPALSLSPTQISQYWQTFRTQLWCSF